MSLDDFERYPLLFGPSPVHPLDRLSDHLGGARIWAKREDCNAGLAYGGNKTRKLEYLLPDALRQGADTLVSIGGVQSNHTRQVAAVAARAGLKAVLIQESWVDWPDAVNDKVGNILLSRIMGANVRLVQAGFGIGVKDKLEPGAGRRTGRGRHTVRDSGGRLGPSARRPRLRELGPRSAAAGARVGRLLRHDRGVQRHRQHPGRHDRRVRGPGPAAAGSGHRRVGEAHRDPRPSGEDSPQHRRTHRARTRVEGRRNHRPGRLGRRPLRRARGVHGGRHQAHRASSKA